MWNKSRFVGPLVIAGLFLVACGADDVSLKKGASMSDVAGVWDSSTSGDVYYTVIEPDGTLSLYDYQADTFGSGDNCYEIDEDAEIESITIVPNGSAYDLVMTDGEFTGVIEKGVVSKGGALHLYDIDEDTAKLGSDMNTVIFSVDSSVPPQSITRVMGVDVSDLNLCDSTSTVQNDDAGGNQVKSNANWLIDFADAMRGAM